MHRSLLIDSDILIDHLRKEKNALDFLDRALEKGHFLFLSVVSRAEIYAGMRKGEDKAICSLFEIVKPVNVDATIADKAGEFLRKFSKSYALNIGDAIIAATASEMELSLVTRNLKHYPMKDISVLKPY